MTKAEMEIKLKELEANTLQLRLEVGRLRRELRSRPTVPLIQPRIGPDPLPWVPFIGPGDTEFRPRITCTGDYEAVKI